MLAGISADGKRRITWGDTAMDEHPKGALTFMLIYLVFITLIWVNAYLRLWWKG